MISRDWLNDNYEVQPSTVKIIEASRSYGWMKRVATSSWDNCNREIKCLLLVISLQNQYNIRFVSLYS